MSNENLRINEIIVRMQRAADVDNDVKLSKVLGYRSTGTISQWRATGRVPDSKISKISEISGVSFAWIKHGIGEMRPEPPPMPKQMLDEIAEIESDYASSRSDAPVVLSGDEHKLIALYRELPDHAKNALIGMAYALKK